MCYTKERGVAMAIKPLVDVGIHYCSPSSKYQNKGTPYRKKNLLIYYPVEYGCCTPVTYLERKHPRWVSVQTLLVLQYLNYSLPLTDQLLSDGIFMTVLCWNQFCRIVLRDDSWCGDCWQEQCDQQYLQDWTEVLYLEYSQSCRLHFWLIVTSLIASVLPYCRWVLD